MAIKFNCGLIMLMGLLCTVNSEPRYSCHVHISTFVKAEDKLGGKMEDCLKIGWIQENNKFGLKSGDSNWCSSAASSNCMKESHVSANNGQYSFNKSTGTNWMGMYASCTIDNVNHDSGVDVFRCQPLGNVQTNFYLIRFAGNSAAQLNNSFKSKMLCCNMLQTAQKNK